ncbi:hypothetical protein HZB89_01305 [archaeon]|nr:hypothetical protein [archaeon]
MNKLLNEEKAQVSAELIIVLAAVVALVLLFVTNIKNFSQKGVEAANKKFDDVYGKINDIGD